MTVEFPALALILLFPAFGVVFNLFLGPRYGRGAVNVVGPGVMFAAFGVATWAFLTLLRMPPGSALSVHLWGWIEAGRFHSELGLRLDALSGVMVMIVTGVGALIHLYSVGYMAHDEDFARFFTYMNLFAFSMLILILANNLLMMFVGWEGVGLCSYLLIAFWYTNPQYAYNGRKAFVVNRIGDAGFLLGMFTIVATLGAHGVWTLDFVELRNHAALLGGAAATAAGFLLFIGATGKSAQIPLYVWLPDAMVGPTPVSALIHAATMVTAGVYMIARLGFIYTMAPSALDLVATIGAVTAVFAATIAIVQPDIKKVLAYSTISQLGYMFLGVGSGAYASGIFHLMTHAFFKGLLFLCAGSVIHALGGEQDMNKMGGLRRKLPITFWTMFIATLAIAAVPPFSGYFSKDLVLEAAYDSGHSWLWFLGVITAGLTSFYMFRLIFMTFFGESRVDSEKQHHLHESPAVMTIPLIVLAILATVGGWVNLPGGLLWGNAFVRFLAPAVGAFKPIVEASPASLSLVASIASALGIALAYLFYLRLPGIPMLLAWRLQDLYNLLLNKYYIDQLYNLIVTRPLFWVSNNVLNRAIDSFAIDGAADGAGLAVQTSGQIARRAETGNVQNYAFVYLLGALGIVAYYLYLVTH
ncbi:MAG: NADH-quinone oxidoreductase subunit L [Candidatus Binatus sp.]|jgi:NADH-quinone oxidoreductase subunit L|uniref:NADH-quinone oxidoreductase subunit L n=1 Tax=Candidatus Binatus sp. TaxID=2811406 RepID=UPI003C7FD2BA